MGCKSTFTEQGCADGFTLVELMIATGLGTMVGAVVVFLTLFTGRSFVTMANYTDLDLGSQLALDQMSRLIHSARQVTACSTNGISLVDAANNPIQFSYDSTTRKLMVASSGQTNVYLTDCNSLQFWIYQHTPISNSFECYAPAYVTNARLVQLTWIRSRPVVGTSQTTESVQSAEIVLRNR